MNILGIDIGGTKCAVSRLREDGRVEEAARFPTTTRAQTLSRIYEELELLRPGSAPLIGISCGGPLDSRKGLILSPPNLPGWDRVAICDELTRRFGGRAFLLNDANACALAEWQFGAGRGCRNMIFLTAGTGMGAGLILDGRLYEGASGDAGEVGHLRLADDGPVGFGKAGSFEGFCSGGGIARLARMRLAEETVLPDWAIPIDELSAKDVTEAAARGDALAGQVLAESGRRLGQALAFLIDILNPERIVLGGLFPRCGDLLMPHVRPVLEKEALQTALQACVLVPAELGETIGSHGAIAAALYASGLGTLFPSR
ncbi:MAG: ROK family protein [Verrucomicrobium sp.]|nr:ROK family protein [Verrucomicrobium sp.]